MKKIFTLALCALLLVSTLSLAGCNNGKTDANAGTKKELVMGLDDQFPPMGFRSPNNEIVGYDIDLAKEVGKRLGMTVKFQPIDWDMKLQELNNGNIDCIWNGFTIKEEFKDKLLYSVPYMKNRQVLVVPKDSKAASKADLKDKKIALQTGSSAEDALNKDADFKKTVTVIDTKDNLKALMEMKAGGVEAVLMDEVVASYVITVQGGQYKILDDALAAEEYGIGFKLGNADLCDKVNVALAEMKADGTMAKISNTWFGKDISIVEPKAK